MAVKNIEININNGSTYDTLYPKTDYSNIINTPTIPNVPISIANGGTGGTTASNAMYNLISPLSVSGTANINNWGAASMNFPLYHDTTSYKMSLAMLMLFISNDGFRFQFASYIGNGTNNIDINIKTSQNWEIPKGLIIGCGDEMIDNNLISMGYAMNHNNIFNVRYAKFDNDIPTISTTTIAYEQTSTISGTLKLSIDSSNRYNFNYKDAVYDLLIFYDSMFPG